MRNRCLYDNENSKSYKGRGITICDRWFDYDLFVEDMGDRPKGTTLDRIDVNKGYFPGNCRWANSKTQANNQSRSAFIEHDGKLLTIGQWCDQLHLTETQRRKAYKRHSRYGASTFSEIFTPKRLSVLRNEGRVNICIECGATSTCKWRKSGRQCNTCWHREYRAKR